MFKRLDSIVRMLTNFIEIYKLPVIHMTSPLEETHISVKSYVLAFLITVFSFALVFNGLTTEEWGFVDLKSKANLRLDQQWWTGEKAASTLSFLPAGKTENFAEPDDKKVKFEIEKECVVVFGTNAAKWPKKVDGIKTDPKYRQSALSVFFTPPSGKIMLRPVISLSCITMIIVKQSWKYSLVLIPTTGVTRTVNYKIKILSGVELKRKVLPWSRWTHHCQMGKFQT
ncbi:TPA: hypothetical protein EYN98_05415 [Candidatus Poribacteria bacterium]|nr:hypothetical protein [Candidatus Poribacteria bacterium]HIB89279.1 hypothetical protein [Candidatus Poribacteria bacterium]HIB99052.1 hypothetical protein [Candidatus Poribacteria bacterium]HIO47378.1 hypothetical protein [Candidatus Poribacteria bacterium]